MHKGHITMEDAQLVHDFAQGVQPMLRHSNSEHLLKTAQTVVRISYCALAEARMNARAERARQPFSSDYSMRVAE